MSLGCGSNKLEKTAKHTLEALDARTACMYAMEFAEKKADREMARFINQSCPDACIRKRILQRTRSVTNLVGRWVRSGGYTVYRATAWVDYVVEVECSTPPPPPPPPPEPPIVTGGMGGAWTPGDDDDDDEPEPVEPPPVCDFPCTCLGPRCPLPPPHIHCPSRAGEHGEGDPLGSMENSRTGCATHGGRCDLPEDHEGAHHCRHGHRIQ